MSNVESTTTDEAYAQFGKWLNEQPFWLQDAAWRIYNNKKIDDEQIGFYAEMCIAQIKDEMPTYKHLTSSDMVRSKSNKKISVLSLSEIKGVNALADNASLEFGEQGITVIYGLNGAGKSGFMRIFKELSGCPYEEPIQPNIFKKNSAETQSCKVVISLGGEQKEEIYDLANKPETSMLSVCDVFDTRISSAYITTTNNVSYQPFIFTLLAELASIADKISLRIAHLKEVIVETSVQLPDDLSSSPHLTWIKNINKGTKIPAANLKWATEQENEILELPKLLDTETVKQKLKIVTTARNALTPVLEDLRTVLSSCNKEKFETAYKALFVAKQRLEAARRLFSDSADDKDKISISSEDWKVLWHSAKEYYETILFSREGVHFGEVGSMCPLCHQLINDEVHKRVSSVNEYVNGSCNTNYQTAKNAFKQLCDTLLQRNLTGTVVKTSLTDILLDDELSAVTSVYDMIETIKQINNEEQRFSMIGKLQINKAYDIISEKIKKIDREIKSLNDALKDESKTKLLARYELLKSEKWVFGNKNIIQRVIENLCRIDDLKNIKQYISTNKITIEANKLAESLITQAYIERFTKELAQMAPGIKVRLEKAPSQKGKSPYKVTIDTDNGEKYRPEDILSEGEQRIVALSAFFADATGRKELTPIIIDDPISSLDLNFEGEATKRIVDIAKTRQVIIFTHRISLLVGLSDACTANEVHMEEIHIRSALKGKGVSDFADTYHGNVKTQLNRLKEKLIQAKKMDVDSEEYRDYVGRICQQVRICVERSVEDVLLLKIVRRFDKNIKTYNLITKLPAIEEKDCKIIDEMMTKYSFVEHSQPLDTLPTQYSAEEIENDITAFMEWIKEYNKKQNI